MRISPPISGYANNASGLPFGNQTASRSLLVQSAPSVATPEASPQSVPPGLPPAAPLALSPQNVSSVAATQQDIPIGPAYILDLSMPQSDTPIVVFWRDLAFDGGVLGPAYVLDISPEAYAYYENGGPITTSGTPAPDASGRPLDPITYANTGPGAPDTPEAPAAPVATFDPGTYGTPGAAFFAPANGSNAPADNEDPAIGIKTGSSSEIKKPEQCKTCASRKYMDRSNDGSVSFQTPTHISPNAAASAVSAHEGEHVSHENAKAARSGGKVVSQTVMLHSSICPECGRMYISGGETKTVTKLDDSEETGKPGKGENSAKKPNRQ